MSEGDLGDGEQSHHYGVQMFHPQYNILFPSRLPFRDHVFTQILQELPFGDPLRIHAVESPDLPPLVTTDDILEVIRTEPIDQYVCCRVASRDGYCDGSCGGPRRGWDVRVCAGTK